MERRKSTYTHDHVCLAASVPGIETKVLMLAQETLLPMKCLFLFLSFLLLIILDACFIPMREEIKGMGGKVGASEKSWGNGNHNKNTLCEKKIYFH